MPINFTLQSDFIVSVSAGYSDAKMASYDASNSKDTNTIISQIINASYSIGFYPNTRTQIKLSPYVALAANQMKYTQEKKEYLGLSTGVLLSGYYYVSPRFRIQVSGDARFISDEFYNDGPFPTTVSSFNGERIWNENNLSGANQFRYNYRVGLSYALF